MKTIAQQLNITEFPFRIKDKNGNTIYNEDSNNYWAKYEYDSNGNVIYYETSRNYWYKCEYDYNENVIYYENSLGNVIDKRPKPYENKVIEMDGVKYKLVKL